VVHPFHPLFGEVYEFSSLGVAWNEKRVSFEDRTGCLRSLPVSWTSLAAPDPFVTLAGGQAFFRTEDLLRLVVLVEQLTTAAHPEPASDSHE